MKTFKTHRTLQLLALLMMLLSGASVKAQFGFDDATVEAFIYDHKQLQSALLARATVEQANEALHEYAAEEVFDYKELNAKLEKYTKCFDYIDLIYNAGRTVFNVKNSYDDIKDIMRNLGQLNQEFIDKCLARGDIKRSDSIVVKTYMRMIEEVTHDAEQLIASLTGLAVTLAPPHACTTSSLMQILNSINDNLDHIRAVLRHGYHILWKYITIRTHYWKSSLYMQKRKTRREICDNAFERWVHSRVNTLNGSPKPK